MDRVYIRFTITMHCPRFGEVASERGGILFYFFFARLFQYYLYGSVRVLGSLRMECKVLTEMLKVAVPVNTVHSTEDMHMSA